jgi:hypothetical protein
MPAFMDGKMDVIEQRQLAPVGSKIEKQQSIENHPADKLDAGDRLPFDFRKMHLNQAITILSQMNANEATQQKMNQFAFVRVIRG